VNADELRAWIGAHKAQAAAAAAGTILVALYLWHRAKVRAAASSSDQQSASSTAGSTGGTTTGGGQYLVPYDGTADYSGNGTGSDGLSGPATLQGSVDALNGQLAQLNTSNAALLAALPGGAVLPGGNPPVVIAPHPVVNPGPTTGGTTGSGAHTGQTSKPGGATTTKKKHAPAAKKAPARPTPATKTKTYTVRHGDTLSAIAKREHLSLSALEKLNPQIKNPNLIRTGEKIKV
jgi:LysM repeat protein